MEPLDWCMVVLAVAYAAIAAITWSDRNDPPTPFNPDEHFDPYWEG